jgi:dTDP-glucose 4,6-dehydratase
VSQILITGGAGFLGSHLCERFLARGESVTCADNLVTGMEENVEHLRGNPGFTFLKADVSQPLQVDNHLDGVMIFASPASPSDYSRLPMETMLAGTLGTYYALELARKHGAKVLLASTSEIYGDPLVHPQTETYWGNVNTIGPRSVYDEPKRVSESFVVAYQRGFGIDVRIARIFNTYGPRMRPNDGRAVPAFIGQALAGSPLTVYGDGSQTRSLCYVDDLVDGIERLWDGEYSSPVNIGNPHEITVLELAKKVCELVGSRSGLEFRPLPVDDPTRRCPDISLARKELGWEPSVALEDGLRKTIAAWKR